MEQRSPSREVHAAIALIRPRAEHLEDCEFEVRYSHNIIQYTLRLNRFATALKRKEPKKLVGRLAAALRRAELAILDLADLNAPIPTPIRVGMLREWREKLERIATSPSGSTTRELAERKRLAVSEAHRLLERYDAHISVERNSNFCRLAALLYGNTRVNLQNQCRVHRRNRNHILDALSNLPIDEP